MSFRGVDLDVWARQLLALLDLVLSADYAVRAYRVDPDAYGRLVAAKNVIAERGPRQRHAGHGAGNAPRPPTWPRPRTRCTGGC